MEGKDFFKATFAWDSTREGASNWKTEIRMFDALTADILNSKIESYIKADRSDYRRSMHLKDIVKL